MKIKIIFLLCVLLIISINSKAQQYVSFPDSNAVWRTVNYGPGCESPNYCKYEDSITGDTLINSLTYHKIIERNNTTFTWHYVAALREANKHIYIIHNTPAEVLYYDFTVAIGDTLRVPQGDTIILSAIDSILINNHYRKQFHFHYNHLYADSTVWIEGIGSKYGLFIPAIFHYPFAYRWFLCCLLQNNVLLYNQNVAPYTFCDQLSSIKPIQANADDINIFPNPSSENITIESPPRSIVEISNIKGQFIKTFTTVDNKTKLDVTAFPGGVYVIEVKTKKGIAVKKFVKE